MDTVVPRHSLEAIGIPVRRRVQGRAIGHALIGLFGKQTIDDVTFGLPGDEARLGERALRGLRLRVDASSGELIDAGPAPVAKSKRGAGPGDGKLTSSKTTAARFLAGVFASSGYTRVPNAQRRKRENQRYKKGYEVRLRVNGKEELKQVRSCLEFVGLSPAKPYAHGRKFVQSVHGKEAMQAFIAMVKESGLKAPRLALLERVT